jgi:hypothetical protein
MGVNPCPGRNVEKAHNSQGRNQRFLLDQKPGKFWSGKLEVNMNQEMTFIVDESGTEHRYLGFSYTKINGEYGYLGVDFDDSVIFIHPHESGIQKTQLVGWKTSRESISF